MKRIMLPLIILLAVSCRDATGPSVQESPGGTAIIWFNGLSATADAYFPGSDSLITAAWITGSAPNQIKAIGNGRFAVLSSVSAELGIASAASTGEFLLSVPLPAGSNPYCCAFNDMSGFSTLLLEDSVVRFSIESGEITGGFSTRSNPSGIEICDSLVFVSYSNWPDVSSPGGVSVYTFSGTEISWLDTGVNTHWITKQPSGMLHCYSTTYQNDGEITIVDPVQMTMEKRVICGGAPGEAVYREGTYISPDGWGEGGFVLYHESGDFERVQLPFSPTGIAVSGDTLYVTSFSENMVYKLDTDDFTVTDSLQSGGEGAQGIIAVGPAG